MGFFSNTVNAVTGGVSSFLGDPLGIGAEVEGLRKAGRIEEAAALEALELSKRAEEAGGQAREAAGVGFEELLGRVNRPLGESKRFQANVQEAVGSSQAALARFGLQDSSTAGLAASDVTSNLALAEEQERLGIAQFLAGGNLSGFNQSIGALQIFGGLKGAQAQSAAGQGAAKAEGRRAGLQFILDSAGTGAKIAALG
jgi:hypothetical protein